MTPAAQIRAWLQATLEQSDMSARGWAQKAGVSPSTLFRALKEDYEFVTSSKTLGKLAAAAGVEPPHLTGRNRDQRLVPLFLPVRHRVQAGLWYEADAYAQTAPSDYSYPVSPDPRYAEWPQWLEEVAGDSVDLVIRPGSLAHVIDAIEMGYSARDKDFVVVERRRAGGSLRERTIKQIEMTASGPVLWPRSSNPIWHEPIKLDAGCEGEEIEVEIVGLVVGSYASLGAR